MNRLRLHLIPVLKCHQLNKLVMYELCAFDERRMSVQQREKIASKEREKEKKKGSERERENERKKNIVEREERTREKCIRKEVSC